MRTDDGASVSGVFTFDTSTGDMVSFSSKDYARTVTGGRGKRAEQCHIMGRCEAYAEYVVDR